MVKIFGSPDKNNINQKKILDKPTFDLKYIKFNSDFRKEILSEIQSDMHVLDVGKSMRTYYEKINCKSKKTLDINIFDDYPDIQLDLSENHTEDSFELKEKFDAIICLAVLEHVYNPFIAIDNLRSMLRTGGTLFGYVPFLYHYHAPKNLEFQDYFRFSKDIISYLLKDFQSIKIYPVRGRMSSSMHLLFGSFWKRSFEKVGFNKYLDKFFSDKKNISQCSGYNFIVKK